METKGKNTTRIAIIGIMAVILILVLSTIWAGRSARDDSQKAVRTVSLLYLNELAGRREQVVSQNLQGRITDMRTALELMTDEDLSDEEHLQAYQARTKKLFTLEKFAFVDEDGVIHTANGTQKDIDEYSFDYKTLDKPDISIKDLKTRDKKVVIALPVDEMELEGKDLKVCFMEIDMDEMLAGVSMKSEENGSTFTNIYTSDGVALTNTVLGGLAVEDNLLEALQKADYEDGVSYEKVKEEFESGKAGVASFTYGDIQETLSYVPVKGTDWFVTYLIRESVISDQIGYLSDGILKRSLIESVILFLALLAIFVYVLTQTRRNAKLRLEKETSDAENRVKQEELEKRIALQDKLLEEESQREQQDKLITALASDYRSVYYIELDKNLGICYQEYSELENRLHEGEEFPYIEKVTEYAKAYVTEDYYDDFMAFVQPENIREGLKSSRVISFTYVVNRGGKESYEMVRFAGVRHPEDREDHLVHAVGACFTDVDDETRKNMAQQQALSDALTVAEEANKAKTAFLSNMSHEIRTPMNAIIGLENIAINDPETPEKTRGYLEKIGSSAEHLLNLINDILDMSRIESGRLILKNEEFSFRELLETINTMFSGQCADKMLDYNCHINGQIDDYYVGDSMKLRQVLINILGNAVKFTPEGGRISLELEKTAEFENQSTLKFRISDTGIGMSKEFIPHIFDTFAQEDSSSTSRFGSTGLGLAITNNIVEMMNGNIKVESEKGKGSVFTVTVTLGNSNRKYDENDMGDIIPSEMSVLVIDDDPVACEHAQLVLGKAGIAAEIAESGAEAIEMVSLRHARRDPYNLILVDWKMPEMDGIETTRRIREIIGDESAIIILTAYRWDDVLDTALNAGVDSFLAKPLFMTNVIEEFKSALAKKNIVDLKGKNKAELAGKRILLAEDVAINAEIMEMVLESRQMEVDIAENGRIAVEKFRDNPAGYYSAILMDMRMPEMDGLEATRTIRAIDREDAGSIPIIALTANAFDEDVQRSMQAGLNAHLSKPVQPEVLYETLESLIQD